MVRERSNNEDQGDDSGGLIEKVVFINRVATVVKGGRRFSFTAVVVVGDGEGNVGFGMGRANEVPDAIRKGGVIAKREMENISLKAGTLSHELDTTFKSSRVVMLPAAPGTGIIAGAAVRAVMECAGVTDVLTKIYGSTNPINVVTATIKGLQSLRNPEEVRAMRLELARAASDSE